MTTLYFNSLFNPLAPSSPSVQRIAEDSSCTPCEGLRGGTGICLNHYQVNAWSSDPSAAPACAGGQTPASADTSTDCTRVDEWCYTMRASGPIPTSEMPGVPINPGGGTNPTPTTRSTTPTPSKTITPTPTSNNNTTQSSIDAQEKEFLRIINEHRAGLGLTQLKPSVKLTKAAEWMSNDMATRDVLPMDHSDSEGRSFEQRMQAFNYAAGQMGENIAKAGPNGQNAFDVWLGSTMGHKEQMEASWAKAIGISRAQKGNFWYWTADFGSVLDSELAIGGSNPTATPSATPSGSGTPTPTGTNNSPTATATPQPTGTSGQNQALELTVNAFLPGIGAYTSQNNSPKRPSRAFTVFLLDESGAVVEEQVTNLTYNNGGYTGTATFNVPHGNYEAKVAADNSLASAAYGVLSFSENKKSFNLLTPILITGNISKSGESKDSIDILDYNLLLSCYESSCAQKTLADLNDDGKVSSGDLNILLRSFFNQGPF